MGRREVREKHLDEALKQKDRAVGINHQATCCEHALALYITPVHLPIHSCCYSATHPQSIHIHPFIQMHAHIHTRTHPQIDKSNSDTYTRKYIRVFINRPG